ncbi:acetoacetate decarboxylase family protein [Bradyrhizobium zhanjiangense]|uniref:acetoacetate decarboxylase family protein n=1 Tax=Bradyrhizobium zhanjiangense TaxID=1325107 RepID=UPI0013E89A03|nr:acetoacetate decarboxylase family protein [Bradyrhizobium zhanjiangense]
MSELSNPSSLIEPLYRMPAHFGPTPGPRQGPDGGPFDWSDQPKRTLIVARFLSEESALQRLLPSGFIVDGEPVVTVEIQYWTALAWLAGRGYNTLSLKLPVSYHGRQRRWTGHFLAVIWENMPDAIISGREELGYNKLYAEIPEPRVLDGCHHYSAHWFGNSFMTLELSALTDAPLESAPRVPGDGILHHKYVPRTGCRGQADADYVTLTPSVGGKTRFLRCKTAEVKLRFLTTTWQQLPTLHHIVNALAAVPILESRGGLWAQSVGARDLSDQMIVD